MEALDLLSPISEDPRSIKLLQTALKIAKSHATVLITGETGTGKELLANYIHKHSCVNQGPFIAVNCAAIPNNMIEAILFGFEKGSFTGATNTYTGKFEQAQNGTLLLDEIAEIPFSLQAKLLRVLQEKEVEKLCGKTLIDINIRIIASTNRDLKEQVRAGLFREDLYYRLNVIPLRGLSLRERPLDILPLADFFIKKYAKLNDKPIPVFTNKAKEKLTSYNWPGNIREIENLIQRTLIMTDGLIIDDNDILLTEDLFQESIISSQLKAGEAKLILGVLKETDGSRNIAAKRLNISPRTLRYKISKLKSIGLEVPK